MYGNLKLGKTALCGLVLVQILNLLFDLSQSIQTQSVQKQNNVKSKRISDRKTEDQQIFCFSVTYPL